MTTRKEYFHLCSDGTESPDFILSTNDFVAAMNIVALCAANTAALVIAFTLEDTHLHLFLYGTRVECVCFKGMFESVYVRYASRHRDSVDAFKLRIELYSTGNDVDYVRNVAAYTVIQPTKDGKAVMPFDYLWGSGSLYFRAGNIIPVWMLDKDGRLMDSVPFGSLGIKERRACVHSRTLTIPDSWLVCGGLVLPSNYVDVEMFESIFRTHNCYRVFLSGSRAKEAEILRRMASERGIMLQDMEARRICADECKSSYGIRDPRRLSPQDRVSLAQALRRKYGMTIRQIAGLIRLPEKEVMRYVP